MTTITPLDIKALGELLTRTPMTTSEALYANDLMTRLIGLLPPEEPEAEDGGAAPDLVDDAATGITVPLSDEEAP